MLQADGGDDDARGAAKIMQAEHEWFFTAPWERVYTRRGDALGLRGLTDGLADLLAPGLTNRTVDARWISILSWCLTRSHEVWLRSGGGPVRSREAAVRRYAWLRPLELMWVARSLELAKDDTRGRQLPGRRRVSVWLRDEPSAAHFAMTHDQFRAYRQTGAYGAYRTLFLNLPGLTLSAGEQRKGDGWTPGSTCLALAGAIDKLLGNARVELKVHTERKLSRRWTDEEDRWWIETWPNFASGSARSLPRKAEDVAALEEAGALRPLLFADTRSGARRSRVANVLSKSRAGDHLQICEELAAVLRSESDGPQIAMLPAFSRLADAGMDVMDAISGTLARSKSGPGLSVAQLAAEPAVQSSCAELASAAKAWLVSPRTSLRHIESADRLASTVVGINTREQLQQLIQHHVTFGGGVRWFAQRGDLLEPLLRPFEQRSARYRFRLWPLARMAAQSGETSGMPPALRADERALMEDDDE